MVVCYADDLVAGFEHRDDAEPFLSDFQERLAKFGLELHPDEARATAAVRFCRVHKKESLTRRLHSFSDKAP
jgi:RNA-directed DNA polymerase